MKSTLPRCILLVMGLMILGTPIWAEDEYETGATTITAEAETDSETDVDVLNQLEQEPEISPAVTPVVPTILPKNPLVRFEPRQNLLGITKNNEMSEMRVTTATKRPQLVAELPGSITIITEEEIKQKGALTLRELLLHFTSAEFDYDMMTEHLRFRGMDTTHNNKILLLIDGRKVNTVDWGNFDTQFAYALENIKRIEIVKGPGSSLYGANAFAGVINIISKTGVDIQGVNTKVSVGVKSEIDDPSLYTLVNYGELKGDYNYLVSAGYWSEHTVDPINRGIPNDNYLGSHFDASLIYKEDWVLRAGYRKLDLPNPGSDDYNGELNHAYEELMYLDVAQQVWQTDVTGLQVRLSDNYDALSQIRRMNYIVPMTKINQVSDIPSGGSTIIIDESGQQHPVTEAIGHYFTDAGSAIRLWQGGQRSLRTDGGPKNEGLAEVQWNSNWPDDNYLIAGASYAHTWAKGEYGSYESVVDQNFAGYLQDEMHFLDNLIFLAGLRWDYNLDYQSNLTPRASVVYSPLAGWQFKALYGSAFRAPSITERYTYALYGISLAQGSQDLKPEEIEQSEASIEYSPAAWLNFKGNYFYWETTNEIVTDFGNDRLYVYLDDLQVANPDFPAMPGLYYTSLINLAGPNYTWTNANSRIARGYELETMVKPWSFITCKLNYAHFYQWARQALVLPAPWANGEVDIFNAVLEFTAPNGFFINAYAHVNSSPKSIAVTALDRKNRFTEHRLLQQYDVSLGGTLRGVQVTLAVMNILESRNIFNVNSNEYVNGPRIIRLLADYTFHF